MCYFWSWSITPATFLNVELCRAFRLKLVWFQFYQLDPLDSCRRLWNASVSPLWHRLASLRLLASTHLVLTLTTLLDQSFMNLNRFVSSLAFFLVWNHWRMCFFIIKVRLVMVDLFFLANSSFSERQWLLSELPLKQYIVCKNLFVFPELIEETLRRGSIGIFVFHRLYILFQLLLLLKVYPWRRGFRVIELTTVFELSE